MKLGKRVLFLDDHLWWLDDVKNTYELDVVQHGQSLPGSIDYPRATKALQAEICRLIAETPPFDLIVIGNNMGTGLGRAEAIPDAMKGKTVIIWNPSSGQDGRDKYEKMGFRNFAVRDNALTQEFLRILDMVE